MISSNWNSFRFSELDEVIIPSLRKATAVKARQSGWSEQNAKLQFARVQRRIVDEKTIEYNCAPQKMYMPFIIQIPLWVLMSMALRRLSTMAVPGDLDAQIRFIQFSTEGFFLLPDLAARAPSMSIPILVGIGLLLNNELTANRHAKDLVPGKRQKKVSTALRVLAMSMIPLAAVVPSAMSLYWLVSAYSGLAVNLAIMSPRVRNWTRIPESPLDNERPYRVVLENMQSKSSKIVNKILRR